MRASDVVLPKPPPSQILLELETDMVLNGSNGRQTQESIINAYIFGMYIA